MHVCVCVCRFDNISAQPVRRGYHSDSDSSGDSEIAANVSDDEEDIKDREDALKAELYVSTRRLEELKTTVQATKSFIQVASSHNVLSNPRQSFNNGTVVSTIESEANSDGEDEQDDEDTYVVDDENNEFEVPSRM